VKSAVAIGVAASIAGGTVIAAVALGMRVGEAFPAGPYAVPTAPSPGCPQPEQGLTVTIRNHTVSKELER
jgi:hypothetical protein